MQTFLDSRPLAREKQHIGEAAWPAAPDSLDLADTRHAKSMTVRSSADFCTSGCMRRCSAGHRWIEDARQGPATQATPRGHPGLRPAFRH